MDDDDRQCWDFSLYPTVGRSGNYGCRQLWGNGARAPFNFQLFNFSGHFRAGQTLIFNPQNVYRPITLSLFIIFCVCLPESILTNSGNTSSGILIRFLGCDGLVFDSKK